jgi:hypothetical protein
MLQANLNLRNRFSKIRFNHHQDKINRSIVSGVNNILDEIDIKYAGENFSPTEANAETVDYVISDTFANIAFLFHCLNGDLCMIKLLEKENSFVNIGYYAIDNGNINIIKFLLAKYEDKCLPCIEKWKLHIDQTFPNDFINSKITRLLDTYESTEYTEPKGANFKA